MIQLRKSAIQFVTEVLTEVDGKRPSGRIVRVAADRIVKALQPVVGSAAAESKVTASHDPRRKS